ncbi:hypothetical protein OA502_00205 [Prochlorococcus sp. AH-716-I05]|nr:hypothetical protein [Prochlorococcus sp. AH-716-I05]
MQIDIGENREELIYNYFSEKNSEKYNTLADKIFSSLKKLPNTKLILISKGN